MNRKIKESSVDWLLEMDDVGIKHLPLRDLVGTDARELANAP